MARTVVVTLIGVCLTLLLISFGTSLILNTTEFGKVAMGHTELVSDPWKTFFQGQNIFFLYIDLPATLVVGFLAARFAKRFSVASAVIATAPASGLLLVAQDIWRGLSLVACAAGVGYATQRIQRRRKESKE